MAKQDSVESVVRRIGRLLDERYDNPSVDDLDEDDDFEEAVVRLCEKDVTPERVGKFCRESSTPVACAAIEAHVRGQGYVLLDAPPTAEDRLRHPRLARFDWGDDGYPAAMSSPEEPGVARVMAVMKEATDGAVRIAPLMGGSLPIAPIGDVLGTPFVIVPIVNADNNQHAPNENLRMKEFRRGIALYAALLAEGGKDW